jgi:hypothetical protein
MNYELERIWKESVMAFYRYYPIICLERQRLGSVIRMHQTRMVKKFVKVSQKVEGSEGPDWDDLNMWRMIYENRK